MHDQGADRFGANPSWLESLVKMFQNNISAAGVAHLKEAQSHNDLHQKDRQRAGK